MTPAASSPPARRGLGGSMLLIVGSCTSLQFGAALATQLFPSLGALGVTALRLSIAAIVLLVVIRPRLHRWTRAQWIAVVLYGLALACMNGFFYAAISRIPLGTAVSIELLGPLVLAAILSRRAVDLCWVGLALAGMAALGAESLIGEAALDPIGVVFALGAATFWALYIRTGARVARLVPGTGGLAAAFTVAMLVLLPFGIPAGVVAATDPQVLLLAVGTALLASVIPYSLELAALRRLPQNVFGVLLSLEPAIAALAGWLLLGQVSGPLVLVAIGLVVVASIGTTLTARAGAAPLPPDTRPIELVGARD